MGFKRVPHKRPARENHLGEYDSEAFIHVLQQRERAAPGGLVPGGGATIYPIQKVT